jgi:hypothetical protein
LCAPADLIRAFSAGRLNKAANPGGDAQASMSERLSALISSLLYLTWAMFERQRRALSF